MKKGGLIIRLIDVAMIILFGFIIISRLKMSEIELPSTMKSSVTEIEKYIVRIKIYKDTINRIDRYVLFENDTELRDFKTIDELERILVTKHNLYREKDIQLVVLIEPDRDSIIQYTVDVLDLCTKHSISKNINYESNKI